VHPECRKRREREGIGAFSLPFPSVAGSDNSCKAKEKIFHEKKKKIRTGNKDDRNRWSEVVIVSRHVRIQNVDATARVGERN
jgi:hypothetical protein